MDDDIVTGEGGARASLARSGVCLFDSVIDTAADGTPAGGVEAVMLDHSGTGHVTHQRLLLDSQADD